MRNSAKGGEKREKNSHPRMAQMGTDFLLLFTETLVLGCHLDCILDPFLARLIGLCTGDPIQE